MLPVSLDCLFLFAPSVFSNVYVLTKHNQEHATYNGFWNGNKQCSKFTKTTKYYHNYSTDLYYNSTSYLKIDVVCQTICINNNVLETLSMQGVLDTTLCDKICQWLVAGRWFSPCTPVSCTDKTDRHNITEILLKVALNTITPNIIYK